MRVSFVLHLDTAALAGGELRGDIEEVGSGRRGAVRHLGDIEAFLAAPGEVPPVAGLSDGASGMSPQ